MKHWLAEIFGWTFVAAVVMVLMIACFLGAGMAVGLFIRAVRYFGGF